MTTAEHELPVGPAQAELAARLHALEEQPLAERADGYVQLHDEMRDRLEGGDAAGTQD
ncbi:hypothetical protein [Microterricola viridarii]|uniref:Uncharacterized protein n=1 Tax=Microterricola viridarii TaxID=412690 RepID=A0A1H1WWH7_9MICO|nr:hypothetical protein [Microterricola viridarii]SDT00529.1 hypothetical protein SAMN04489834_2619 [Microterricola viridarii]